MLKQFYYKKNRIQQLKGFYHAIQEGSISAAAKKMGLTQSAVTLQVQSLERDLGVQLFTRHAQKIIPTQLGKILYAQSSHFIHGIDSIFEGFIDFAKNKENKLIDIASNHAGISYILPKYIKKFMDDNPGVKFSIRNLSKEDCIKRVLNDEIDFFIYPMRNDEIPLDLEFITIAQYEVILLLNKKHPLYKKKNITLRDVSKHNLVRIDQHLITLPAFEEVIKSYNIKTNINFEMSDWEILKKFVKANIGVAIISNIILEGSKEGEDNLGQVNLSTYFPKMKYSIIFKKGKIMKPLTKNFMEYIVKNTSINPT